MAIGEFGGAPASPGDGGLVLSAPMYWFWEMSHAALNPGARGRRRDAALSSRTRSIRFANTHLRQVDGGRLPSCSSARPAATAGPNGTSQSTTGGRRARAGARHRSCGSARSAGSCISSARSSTCRAGRSRAAHRGADVGPLRDAAARHGRGLPAQPRRLHHRLGRRPHGAAHRRALRSRRLHRLSSCRSCISSAATSTWSRCASRRCRCSRRSPSWRRPAIPTCRIRWC